MNISAKKSAREREAAAITSQFEQELTAEYVRVRDAGLREAIARRLGVPLEQVPAEREQLEQYLAGHTFIAYRSDALGWPEGKTERPLDSQSVNMDGTLLFTMHDVAFENGLAKVRYSIPVAALTEAEASQLPSAKPAVSDEPVDDPNDPNCPLPPPVAPGEVIVSG